MSAASPIRALYASMPDSLARARRKFGRPLTLSEKILVAHCWDFDSQVWERGKAILRLRVDRVDEVVRARVDDERDLDVALAAEFSAATEVAVAAPIAAARPTTIEPVM
jgi:hypothetical protein